MEHILQYKYDGVTNIYSPLLNIGNRKRGENFYDTDKFVRYHSINIDDSDIDRFSSEKFDSDFVLVTGVHPRAYSKLNKEDQQKWVNFLNSKNLNFYM